MVLFRRVFSAVLVLFFLVLGSVAIALSRRQAAEIERQLIDKIRFLAISVAPKLRSGCVDQKWPLEDLRNLSSDQDILFWWVVDPERRIHLADTAATMGTMAPDSGLREMDLKRRRGYGVFTLPLDTGSRRWTFRVGFSLSRVSNLKRRMELLIALGALAALAVLGIAVFFIVRHFLRPIEALRASADAVGRGDLRQRAEVLSRDELGMLAASFNLMVEKLEKTTVSRAYVDEILSSMAESVIVLDGEQRIRTVNRSACQLLGGDEASLVSSPIWKVLEAENLSIDAVLAGKEIANRESWLITASGRVPVLFSASSMPEGHDGARMVISARDITELNQIKAELARARDAALEATRHKSEFLANMSHEIRTPMNGIIGMAELLGETSLSNEQRDYLDAVRASGESLLAIINDVLDVSKIEAGKLQIIPAAFDLRQWFDDLVRPLAFRAYQKDLEFVGAIRGVGPLTVTADADRLRQVIVNLIGNAIKFTDSGGVEVIVEAADFRGGTGELRFSVRDSGIGIAPEKQRIIFESFTQAEYSITGRYGGTGLGLTISSRLVQLMGGELLVESAPGAGSTFHFAIRVPVERSERSEFASRTALLIGEPGASRSAVEGLLAEGGVEVAISSGRDEALSLARRGEEFDLALVDSVAAGLDLAALAGELRAAGALRGECVLLETISGRQSDAYEPNLVGVLRRLKPLRHADLAELLGAGPPEGGQPDPSVLDSKQQSRKLHVLVVDDHPINRKVAAGMLQRRGYRVTLAASGQEALECAGVNQFDLILMDIQMPGMSGLEAAAALRRRESDSGARCPVVALTANAMKGIREQYLAAGMDDYISKPICSDELYRVVDRLTGDAAHLNRSILEAR